MVLLLINPALLNGINAIANAGLSWKNIQVAMWVILETRGYTLEVIDEGVFSIQSEVLYTTRGICFDEKIEINNLPLRLTGNITLTYVELPLLFRVTTMLPNRGPAFIPEPGFTFNA